MFKNIILFLNFLLFNCLVEIPIKSLTDSNIVISNLSSSELKNFVKNGKLDYNQFYIDISLQSQQKKILKIGLDSTLKNNFFISDVCEQCQDLNSSEIKKINYRGFDLNLTQKFSNLILDDKEDIILKDYPINIINNQIKTSKKLNFKWDGVLGLDFQSFKKDNSTNLKHSNLLNYLYDNNYINARQFSFALFYDDSESRLILGGYNGHLIKSAFNFNRLISSKNWMISLDAIHLLPEKKIETKAKSILFDSTTSNFIGPKSDVLQILNHINQIDKTRKCHFSHNYFMICDCGGFLFMELYFHKISFQINNINYTFPLDDLLISFDLKEKKCNYALSYYLPKNNSQNESDDKWIIGTKFFERYYVLFNADSKYIAIAEVDEYVLFGRNSNSGILDEIEMDTLLLLVFALLLALVMYFIFTIYSEGKSSKEFQKVVTDDHNVYIEEKNSLVDGKQFELKEISSSKTKEENNIEKTESI